MIGLFHSQTGTIRINGIHLDEIDKEDLWKKKIAFQEQHVVLFGQTFYECLTFGLNDYDKNNIEELIKDFELEYLLDEQDFKSRVLSGGEKRKISLIRLLSKESSLLILDEPLTYLDKFAKGQLLSILQRLGQEKIVIIVTHEEINNLGLKYINLNNFKKIGGYTHES